MQKIKLIFFFLFLFLLPGRSFASHLVGGEITWRQLGVDTYLVNIVIYRDCTGIPLSDQDVTVTDCKGNGYTLSTSAKKISAKDITPVCKTSCTQCGKTPNQSPGNTSCKFGYGFEQFVYSQKVVFNSSKTSCCKFSLSWDNCCRSGSITTGASGEDFHISDSLNRCIGTDNSPYFTYPPILIIEEDQCIFYSFNAVDDDRDANGNRDSLAYSLYKPQQTSTTNTTWSGSYSYDKPLKFDSFPNRNAIWNPPSCLGFHLDSTTGELTFKAKTTGVTILGLKVEEYGKNSLGHYYKKGEIRRDVQLVVISSSGNHVPTLSGINGGNSTDTNFIAGIQNCFTLKTNDPDKSDTVSLSWNGFFNLTSLNATFTVQKNKQHPTGTFCWKPDTSMISTLPYTFIVNANDDHCPLFGRSLRTYKIYVRADIKDTFSISNPSCGDVKFYAAPKKSSSITSYLWTGDDGLYSNAASFTHHYRKPGRYKYSLSASNLYVTHKDTGSVVVPNYVYPTLQNDTQICFADTMKLSSLVSGGSPPYHYKWSTGDTTSSISAFVSKDTSFVFYVSDSFCTNEDTVNIKVSTKLRANAGKDTFQCQGDKSIISLDSFHATPPYGIWTGNGVGASIFDPSAAGVVIGANPLAYTYTNAMGCVYTDTVNVNILKTLVPSAGTYGPYCADSSLQALKNSISYNSSWNIVSPSASNALVDTGGNYYFIPKNAGAGTHKLVYEESYNGHCPVYDTTSIKVYALPSTPSVKLVGTDSLRASIAAASYEWYLNGVQISDSTKQIFADSTGNYQVQITDNNGCVSPLSAAYAFVYTGISTSVDNSTIHIYPNPTTGILTIEIPGIKEAQISVMNITGQVQFQSLINERAELDLHTLAKGIYLLRIQGKDGVLMERVVKQ